MATTKQATIPFESNKRFVPPYYRVKTSAGNHTDVLEICRTLGLDVKAYLVIETIHKLHRYDKKGNPEKDLTEALEQIKRLLDVVQLEEITKSHVVPQGHDCHGDDPKILPKRSEQRVHVKYGGKSENRKYHSHDCPCDDCNGDTPK